MEIRTEKASDDEAVFELNYLAFSHREDESRLIERIRTSAGFISELSLVAEDNGRIVGHVLFSRAEVIDGEDRHDVIVLAPIAVLPSYQKCGIGGSLIREGLRRCEALGYRYVFLIGHPTYYPKFGFMPARAHGFELKQFEVPDSVFMFISLTNELLEAIKGELRYPNVFWG